MLVKKIYHFFTSGFPGCQSDINRNKTRVRKETDKILESECSAFNGEEFKTRSQIILKMMYFFQVLPFYLLQFCSGMSVGKNYKSPATHLKGNAFFHKL